MQPRAPPSGRPSLSDAMPMKLARWMAFAAFQLAIPAIASAESLRCVGSMVSPGDAKLELLRSCGQPAASDQFCLWNKAPPDPVCAGV